MIPVNLPSLFINAPETEILLERTPLLGRWTKVNRNEGREIVSVTCADVALNGGLLCLQERLPEIKFRQVENSFSLVKSGGSEFRLWWFPVCSFEQSLQLLKPFGYLGLPSDVPNELAAKILTRPLEEQNWQTKKIRAVTNFLKDLASRHKLAIHEFFHLFIAVKKIDPDQGNWKHDVENALEFNKKQFFSEIEPGDIREYRKVYNEHFFITLG